MRLFKGSSGRKNAARPPKPEPEASIGSELADNDQFEIFVMKKIADARDLASVKKKNKGSMMTYLSNDNDDSTVSSITTGDHHRGGFYRFNKPYNNSDASALTSWCCCGSDTSLATKRTFRTGTDNTLLAQNSTFGTLQQSDSRSQYRSSVANGKCCGPDYLTASPSKRPKLLGRRGWGRRSKTTSVMSASLFDTLSDDDLDEELNRTGHEVNNKRGNRKRPMPLRRVLTWKRKPLVV